MLLRIAAFVTNRLLCIGAALVAVSFARTLHAEEAKDDMEEIEDITTMAPFNVKADRFEEFGFRVCGQLAIPGTSYAMVSEVFPNTAASKAGLRPGELITKVDGRKRSVIALITMPKKQDKKWAELASGKQTVTWSLEVHAPGSKEKRTVTMTIPSPSPHWGAKIWTSPQGRTPAVVSEPGPLAGRAREIMDNGIWTVLRHEGFLGAHPRYVAPVLGYEWRFVQAAATRRMWVTQQRGRTEIVFEHKSELGHDLFLTSPSGALGKASCRPPKKTKQELSDEEIRARFESELDFWVNQVRVGTGRWPLESSAAETDGRVLMQTRNAVAARSESFLKLPAATDAQRALFADAVAKTGQDEGCWAYTETSRAFGDDLTTTVRVDPSKRPEEQVVLLKVDGKTPKPAHLTRWKEEQRGASSLLGEVPAISELVDLKDVRVFSEDAASVVFELAPKATREGVPPENLQALFRVNKAQREFEEFSVALRGTVRVAGVAKVTDAGLAVRFKSIDPARAAQPVSLKVGGGVRVLLMKFSRSYEATRSDFKWVAPDPR